MGNREDSRELGRDLDAYLAAVNTFREEGCEPEWRECPIPDCVHLEEAA